MSPRNQASERNIITSKRHKVILLGRNESFKKQWNGEEFVDLKNTPAPANIHSKNELIPGRGNSPRRPIWFQLFRVHF